MLMRRALAVPLIVVGGLLYAALWLATIAVSFYVLYVGVRYMVDGDWARGFGVFLFGGTIATFVLGLLTIPAGAMLAAGEWLWNGAERLSGDELEQRAATWPN